MVPEIELNFAHIPFSHSMEGDSVEQGLGQQPVVDTEEEIPYTAETLPLSSEVIQQHISLIARTASGTSHAFTRLEIHDAQITSVAEIKNYPHLRYIDLSENHLVNVNELDSLEYLLSLNLQNNLITTLPAGLDKKKYLQHVNLAKNRLKDLSMSWPLLTFLNLNDNKLTEDVKLDALPELNHLELRGNKLKTTPTKLDAPKLQRLYLAANEITSLKLNDLATLQVLNLRGNKIDNLDGLDGLTSLTYLNLRGNKIETQDEVAKLQKLPSLKILVLSDNPIAAIENYRMDTLTKLSKLDRLDKEAVTVEERDEILVNLKAIEDAAKANAA